VWERHDFCVALYALSEILKSIKEFNVNLTVVRDKLTEAHSTIFNADNVTLVGQSDVENAQKMIELVG